MNLIVSKNICPLLKLPVFYGGVSVAEHKKLLSTDPPHIVIGTPGRILDLAEQNALNLKNIKFFVLDECDKMLEELSMRSDVQKIFQKTPHEKQVLMFSATLSPSIRPVVKKFMHNPLEIFINEGSKLTLHGLQQYYLQIDQKSKLQKLTDLMDVLEFNQIIIFVNNNHFAIQLANQLKLKKFPAIFITSSLRQEERIKRYEEFKDFKARIMIATNLFGRGIDIERVNVVVNYDMPENSDTYLHRVGRAGRFGTKGLAISFVSSENDAKVLNEIQEKFVVQIPELPDHIDTSSYK